MDNVVRFPGAEVRGFQRVKSTYTVREISHQFGLSEHHIRRWAKDGLIAAVPDSGELRYDFRALGQFRRIRELRGQGLSIKQIEAELRGQLNLFPEPEGQLIRLPRRLSPFEEALLLHEHADKRASEAYRKAIQEGDSVADAYCNLGILEFEAGNLPAAFDRFTRALKADPRHFESHYNLASLYFDGDDLRLARLHYEFAAEIEPNFADIF
jgi:DNA-binding transcriptional MerR regulator